MISSFLPGRFPVRIRTRTGRLRAHDGPFVVTKDALSPFSRGAPGWIAICLESESVASLCFCTLVMPLPSRPSAPRTVQLPAFFVLLARNLFLFVLLCAAIASSSHAQTPGETASSETASSETASPRTIAFEGGQWFDGTQFIGRTLYIQNGRFTGERPAKVDTTISLNGHYVVPPFAEAHTHKVDQASMIEGANRAYLEDGVFYVANLNNLPSFANSLREQLSGPTTIDAAFAHGGFTAPGDHPQPLYENLIERGVYDGWTTEDLPGEAFHAVTDSKELQASFQTIMADNPDIIKAYLMYAETDNAGGLTPELLAELVEMADTAGIRVTVHAQDANDVRLAAEAGAHQIAHMPPMPFRHDSGDRYRISPAVARLLAEKNVSVITTTVLVSRFDDGERKEYIRSIQRENLTTLQKAGVRLAVGSDTWSSGQNEAMHLHDLGVFDNQTLLRMWTDTGSVIFPGRTIGRLAPDYEASLLALSCNPLDDFTCVDNIDMRIKQGVVINLPPVPSSAR